MLFDDINEVKLMGNITQDPDLRFISSGSAVLNFSIATNRSYKQGDDWKEESTFHNIVVWGNLAEQVAARVKKGTRVYLDGRLQVRTWESDGKKNYKTEIVASNVILIDRYNKDVKGVSSNSSGADPVKDLGMKPASQLSADESPADVASNTIDPDDLPF